MTNGRDAAREEVEKLQYSAKGAVHTVAFRWLFVKVLGPLIVLLLIGILYAMRGHGLPGLALAILVMGVPLVLIFIFTGWNLKKLWSFWKW